MREVAAGSLLARAKPQTMRTYDPARLAELEDPATLTRLKPFLSDAFDPISLDRPGFLAEIGLQPTDENWLRAGAFFWTWLTTPVLPRAFAEEARSRNQFPEVFLQEALGLTAGALWVQGERLYLRCERILHSPSATKTAASLGLKLAELEALRARWKAEMPDRDQALLDGFLLQLRGVGQQVPELAKRMEAQTFRRVFWLFVFKRPMLSALGPDEVEVTVGLVSPLDGAKRYSVSASFAREFAENSDLSPELWAKQWTQFLAERPRVSGNEFLALLDHFQDQNRYKWPNLVAVGGAKARRAVAAVALQALQKLDSANDTAALERLWKLMDDDFAARHELQSVLKKRFKL
jgi:hypothetical protein